jgi:hypothetical protein
VVAIGPGGPHHLRDRVERGGEAGPALGQRGLGLPMGAEIAKDPRHPERPAIGADHAGGGDRDGDALARLADAPGFMRVHPLAPHRTGEDAGGVAVRQVGRHQQADRGSAGLEGRVAEQAFRGAIPGLDAPVIGGKGDDGVAGGGDDGRQAGIGGLGVVAVLHVDAGADPAQDAPVGGVALGGTADQVQPGLAILTEEAVLRLIGLARADARRPGGRRAQPVVGVDRPQPAVAEQLGGPECRRSPRSGR